MRLLHPSLLFFKALSAFDRCLVKVAEDRFEILGVGDLNREEIDRGDLVHVRPLSGWVPCLDSNPGQRHRALQWRSSSVILVFFAERIYCARWGFHGCILTLSP